MTMDELSARQTLATYEQEYEDAEHGYTSAVTREYQIECWERRNDLARTIRGHCVAYNLVPSVDVGGLHG